MTTEITIYSLPELAETANAGHLAAVEAGATAMAHALAAGEALAKAKAQMPHGDWLPWLAENCRFSARTSQLYIRLHEHREALAKAQRVAHLTVRQATLLLAKPATEAVIDALGSACDRLQKSIEFIPTESTTVLPAEAELHAATAFASAMDAAEAMLSKVMPVFSNLVQEPEPSDEASATARIAWLRTVAALGQRIASLGLESRLRATRRFGQLLAPRIATVATCPDLLSTKKGQNNA